ncbi:MAG TPA: hypothetical protein DCX53_00270 [Anaerolineae bacterium]|nr:hypothetical protein [Anaerolineae bacterium]
MGDERRFFGMTRMQTGIIGSLAALLILLSCVGGWLLFGNAGIAFSSPATQTPQPTVTSAVVTLPTLTPTITPTPIPYERLIPADWKQYKTSLVEIWMPGNFKLADNKTKDITAKFGVPDLLLTEVTSKSSAYTMLVSVSYDLMTGDSLDALLDEKFPAIPYQARITDKRTVFVNTHETRRIVIEFKVNNIDYNNLIYIFQDGSTIWYVSYVAQIAEFFDNLPVFEQSVQTFRPASY